MARQDVDAAWARIEGFASAEAPVMLEELRGPADVADLDAFEAASGLSIPEGLRESLLRHDGEDGPRYSCVWADGGELLSARQICEWWRSTRDFVEEPNADEIAEDLAEDLIEVVGPVWATAIHPRWIPFMLLNGGDRAWYVDLAPREGGSSGQVIVVDAECGTWRVEAESFEAFLEGYAAKLEAGAYPERDEDGVPTAGDDEDPEGADDLEGHDAESLGRLNEAIQQTMILQDVERLSPGAEAEVAGVVLESSWLGKRHEVSVWGGAIWIEGALPKDRAEYLKLRVRITDRERRGEPIYELVSCEPLLNE